MITLAREFSLIRGIFLNFPDFSLTGKSETHFSVQFFPDSPVWEPWEPYTHDTQLN